MGNAAKYAAGIIVIIVIVGIIVYAAGVSGRSATSTSLTTAGSTIFSTIPAGSTAPSTSVPPSPSTTRTPVAVTDPAQVPVGTQAMVVSYSSVQVENGNGEWVDASGSGSINLAATTNSTSQIIAFANLTANTTVQAVQFAVTSANISVNGTTYSVAAPGTISAQVVGNADVRQNSSILVDLSPVVMATYSQNTTEFSMSSSSKAVVVSNSSAQLSATVGASVPLNSSVIASLAAATPSIAITSAALAVSQDNSTSISMVVKNDGNSAVQLEDVVMYGRQEVHAQASGGINAAAAASLNSALLGTTGLIGLNAGLTAAFGVAANIRAFQAVGFELSGQTGSLVLVNSTGQSGGYVALSPGQSATLSYTGTVSYNSGMFVAAASPGSQYSMVVTGSGGATASTAVTAS